MRLIKKISVFAFLLSNQRGCPWETSRYGRINQHPPFNRGYLAAMLKASIFVILFLFGFIPLAQGLVPGYQNARQITIDSTKVSGATDLSDFPVLVSLSGAWIKTTSNGGRIENPNGYDIVFYDGAESALLDHEIEQYDGTTGVLVAWVRVPIVSYNTDTNFYIEYGNSSIGSSQENPGGVWDVNYAAVWHLNESVTDEANSNGVHADSTNKANHGDQRGNDDLPGKISNGQNFDGINDRVRIVNSPSLDITSDKLTIEAWVKFDADYNSSSIEEATLIAHEAKIEFRWVPVSGSLFFDLNTNGWSWSESTRTNWIGGTWYYVVGIYDGTNNYIYVDGSLDVSSSDSGNLAAAIGDMAISWNAFVTNRGSFPGTIDEVRISSVARSADWIATEHNNQNDSSSFYTLGAEQATPSQVTGLTATAVPGQINLSWTTPSGGSSPITGYKIERRTCSGSWSVLVADTGTTGTSYSDTTVVPATCYGYRVAAINGVGMGAASGESTDTAINLAPTAAAGPDRMVDEAVTVALDASNSSDPEDRIDSYLWTQLSGTSVTLSDAAAVQPTFTSPIVGSGGEALTFEVKVTDNGGLASTDTCIVNVTWSNIPPAADAGSDQAVDEGVVVTLDGSNSTDSDDGIASYQWTQSSGKSVTLSDATAIQPTFTAPNVESGGDSLTFQLMVTDVGGLAATDTVAITVNDLTAPDVPVIFAVAGTIENQPTLDWKNVSDASHYVVEYDGSAGFGSAVTISNITLSYYQIQSALGDGTWYWRVKAVDSAGNQSAWSSTGSFIVDTSAYCLLDPEKPELMSPADGAVNVSRVPTLGTGPFVDPDSCSLHDKTRWQISEYFDFSLLSADIEAAANYLTSYACQILGIPWKQVPMVGCVCIYNPARDK
jgi:hypothetical protein